MDFLRSNTFSFPTYFCAYCNCGRYVREKAGLNSLILHILLRKFTIPVSETLPYKKSRMASMGHPGLFSDVCLTPLYSIILYKSSCAYRRSVINTGDNDAGRGGRCMNHLAVADVHGYVSDTSAIIIEQKITRLKIA